MYDGEGRMSPEDELEAGLIFQRTMWRAAYQQPQTEFVQDPDGNWHAVLVPVNVPQIAAQEYVKFKTVQYALMRYALLWCLIVIGPLMFWDVYSDDFFHQFVMWAWFVTGNIIWLYIVVIRVRTCWPQVKVMQGIP